MCSPAPGNPDPELEPCPKGPKRKRPATTSMDMETLYDIVSDKSETAVRRAAAEEELIRRNASANLCSARTTIGKNNTTNNNDKGTGNITMDIAKRD